MAADKAMKKRSKGINSNNSSTTGGGGGGFQSLGLSAPIFRGVMAMGYKVPTPIQRKSLPAVLSGKDIVAMARTGSGKTAAFLIPMLEKLAEHTTKVGIRAVVLSPTRELAVQTIKFTKSMMKFTNLKACLIVGGDGIEAQFESLSKNPDIVVATPGRLMHLLQEIPEFNLKKVEYVVFDEADRIFEMGFAEQLQEILKNMPDFRQTLLFSATMPKALAEFARAGLNDPELIRLDVENQISENLKMSFITMRSGDKNAAFLYFIRDFIPDHEQTIVFAATRHHVEFLHELLKASGIESSSVYGEMDQTSRKINIGKFRAKKTNILIVTDVAARGIDIPLLNNVLNYTFPPTPKLFIHRVGRAARAGRSGTAFNFVDPDELPFMVDLYLFLGRRLEDCSPINKLENGQEILRQYDVESMTVEDVHYGTIPREIIDAENEGMNEIIQRHPTVSPLVKVCDNAFKMYSRSRSDPSKQSIRRTRDLNTSKLHPFFANFLDNKSSLDKSKYLESLTSFRPNQTIFEVTTGTHSVKKNSVSVVMMKEKRKLHSKIIHTNTEKKALQMEKKEIVLEEENSKIDITSSLHGGLVSKGNNVCAADVAPKRKISKAERKRIKKRALGSTITNEDREEVANTVENSKPNKELTFKDEENYIGYMKESDHVTENAFSIKDSGKSSSVANSRLEEAILDVNPDEAMALNSRKRVMHWDSRKRKYVKTTVGELSNGKLKRRNESGAIVSKKAKVGELYQKWQQRNNKRISRNGDDEDAADSKLDYRNGRRPVISADKKKVKNELLSESAIRKEEVRKDKSRGIFKKPNKKKFKKGNVPGKSHGAPTRSKAIIRR